MSDTVDISDRTPEIRDGILEALGGGVSAGEVTKEQLASIKTLDFYKEHLVELKVGDFEGLTGLVVLDLSFNHIKGLEKGIFDGLERLERVHLSQNLMTELPEGVFDGLSRLCKLRELYTIIYNFPNNPI